MDSGVPLIDFHTHRQRHGNETIEVISLHGDQQKPCHYFTRGFHPWWTDQVLTSDQLQLIEQDYLDNMHCLGIGECGLDNLKGVNIELQEAIFIQQIELANRLGAPLIVHAVRAYDRVIRLKKSHGRTPWVIHGFVRNKILASQILDAGILVSVAPNDIMAPSFVQMLQYLPLEKCFLETDSDDRLNISERYSIFATVKQIDLDNLKEQMFLNFKQFYSVKWKYQNGWSEQHS